MFNINLATLFPEMCLSVLNCSILNKASKLGCVNFNIFNIRDFAFNKNKTVDDAPYGGGCGMLMKADPIFKCYEHIKKLNDNNLHVVYLTPKGNVFNQTRAIEFSKMTKSLLFICGHYEGIDQRVIDEIVDEEVSIGDYVLTGGELAALVVIDSVVRLLPGVLSNSDCYKQESHFSGLLECPQYTRPRVWHEKEVPEILLSGHHLNIENWKREKALQLTKKIRPDLLKDLKEKH